MTLDETVRGVPPGSGTLALQDVPAQGWRPASGDMTLPVLTLDLPAFAGNAAAMLAFARQAGVAIAPHAKTPMIPELAAMLMAGGAWGMTVANLRQALVMLRAGIDRLIFANELGGPSAARHLARVLRAYPDAQILFFADSPAIVRSLAAAARMAGRRHLPVLVEMGAARAGARTLAQGDAVMAAILAEGQWLRLAGVGTYEGTISGDGPADTISRITTLLSLTAKMFTRIRRAEPDIPLTLTAGGSVYYDQVLAQLAPIAAADGNATLILRSGAAFFQDHGPYEQALHAVAARKAQLPGQIFPDLAALRPALRLWAEVLSRPEEGVAICGFGLRDASNDAGLPRPLAAYRDGGPVADFDPSYAMVTKLNDQHAFLCGSAADGLQVGDCVEFGIAHPCTCLDRWRILFALDADGVVTAAYQTEFG
ncbi:alanine racemase [Gluconacetobacter tumulisoli]|uniref:Amino acid deaminase n=1 Tax=Gluconacetobacter tumulisoli TaxID=1286189 RepID=A0A7W4K5I4_9PROT|nr:alanine racemase [Gluconacetobacter tumulisoli]MBB2200736.1 amino acid deaminase [Gluconacetobacter tumulisoli]